MRRQTRSNNYTTILEIFKNYDNKYKLGIQDYKLIINTFFYILKTEILEKGKVFVLPKKLGAIGVKKYKMPKGFRGVLNYQHFRKTGERVYLKNTHSEQYMATLHWDKSYRRFNDPMTCMFKIFPAREFSRDLAKIIKEENAISRYYDK